MLKTSVFFIGMIVVHSYFLILHCYIAIHCYSRATNSRDAECGKAASDSSHVQRNEHGDGINYELVRQSKFISNFSCRFATELLKLDNCMRAVIYMPGKDVVVQGDHV